MMRPDNPVIVQSDRTIMLHTVTSVTDESGAPVKDEAGRPVTEEHPLFAAARDALAVFAELEKSPDYLHTYRITPVSIWNAAALGVTAADIQETLEEYSCVPVPAGLIAEIDGWVSRYGELKIERDDEGYTLRSRKPEVMEDVLGYKDVAALVEVGDERLARALVEAQGGLALQLPVSAVAHQLNLRRAGGLDGDALDGGAAELQQAAPPEVLRSAIEAREERLVARRLQPDGQRDGSDQDTAGQPQKSRALRRRQGHDEAPKLN